MYQNKNFTHNTLHFQTANKSVVVYDKSDLNTRKTKDVC